LSVLPPLKDLDEVAYLRFASVYQAFDSLSDFEAAVSVLRAERERAEREQAAQSAVGESSTEA
jgi:transcriptional repressor NrdR